MGAPGCFDESYILYKQSSLDKKYNSKDGSLVSFLFERSNKNTKENMKQFEVGEEVTSPIIPAQYGHRGRVSTIKTNVPYPIIVESENGIVVGSFTIDGRQWLKDRKPSLFHYHWSEKDVEDVENKQTTIKTAVVIKAFPNDKGIKLGDLLAYKDSKYHNVWKNEDGISGFYSIDSEQVENYPEYFSLNQPLFYYGEILEAIEKSKGSVNCTNEVELYISTLKYNLNK